MKRILFATILIITICARVMAQIPVEVFGGHERTTVDIMFFKYFKNLQGANTKWLFFNRNRAGVDYRITKTTYLPQFGFTEAVSYNHEKLKGFAPVLVTQVLNTGVYPKVGIQYAHVRQEITVFTWLVCETMKHPDIDFFILFRYTPKLSTKTNLFTQLESVNSFPTVSTDNYSFTQRIRLGIGLKTYQFGLGADFNQYANNSFVATNNAGIFLRHEF